MMSEFVKEVGDQQFKAEVLSSKEPVLVDFWAPWCGPCRMLGPTIEQIAKEYQGRIKVVKLNTQDNPRIPTEYGIRSIPTVLLFHGDRVVTGVVGAFPKAKFNEMIDGYLEAGSGETQPAVDSGLQKAANVC